VFSGIKVVELGKFSWDIWVIGRSWYIGLGGLLDVMEDLVKKWREGMEWKNID
jgi:hypothetical protein